MIALPATLIIAYVSGSIPAGVWVARLVRRIDIRAHGSRNTGAANVARVVGLRWGLLVGAIDVLKGFAPAFWLGVVAARAVGWGTPDGRLLVGAAAVVGHLFPVFAGFRGGKGVLTALGVFLAVFPVEAIIGAAVWVIVFAIFRIVSVGSLTAALAFAAAVMIRRWVFGVAHSNAAIIAAAAAVALVFLTHHANIGRLLAGTEPCFRSDRSRSLSTSSKTR